MKAFSAAVWVSVILAVSTLASSACGFGEPLVGVKEGDWMEYKVNIVGVPPPIHNVTWMRMDILQVEDSAFPVNLTVKFVNGTFYSTIWRFNFTEGNTEGWLIIPSNLNPNDTFYDNYSKTGKNIAIEGQTQRTVLTANRQVTFGNDSFRTKQWDKATGVFVQSSETLKNWSVNVELVATNLWSPQILGLNQNVFYGVAVSSCALAASFSAILFVVRKRRSGTV